MTRPIATLALIFVLSRSLIAGEIKVDGKLFTLPEGFTIERVAGPPLVDRPIVADFDEQGRLYVADSSGSNAKVEVQLQEKPHRIVRLEDSDGDGVYDKRTIFADKMMFPEGAMWRDGSLYISAPPSIWKLTDTNGDGVADVRVEWFQGKTLTGCANDLHGPYNGPDGWIYWCKGAFARQTYDRPGRSPFSTRASHIFRCRPDGSGLEPVMTGGMDNPVDVVFTPGGERIFSCTFLQHPGGGRRDGLIHDVYGAVYGKVQALLDEHPRTGPELMPALTHLGPAAPCGLARYESNILGEDYQNNLFACQFNLRKVSRHVVVPEGATFVTQDHEFLASPDQDFHPTDVLEDADGSLLVVDTGGWYKLCCPTSQLEKPDVLGAIYRIRRVDAPRVDDPRGLAIDWKSLDDAGLVKRLDDERPAVRNRAIAALAHRGTAALPALDRAVRGGASSLIRQNALWAATRIDGVEARAIVREGLRHPESLVRQIALNSISLWRDAEAVPMLVEVLHARTPEMLLTKGLKPQLPIHASLLRQNQRAAAEALGRIGARSAIPEILDVLKGPNDRVLDHSLTYALIELNDPDATVAGLKSSVPSVRRAAIVALDQMESSGIKPEMVIPSLSSTDPNLRESAVWVAGRHLDWSGRLAGVFADRLRSKSLPDTERAELENQLGRFSKTAPIVELLGSTLRDALAPIEARRSALAAISRAGLKETPESWASGLSDVLGSDNPGLVAQGVSTVRSVVLKGDAAASIASKLLKVAARSSLPIGVRLEALAAVPGGLAKVDPETFALLRGELDPDRPVATRLLAADVLSKAKLSTDQLKTLADLLAMAGPLEVDRLLAAFEATTDEATGLRLLSALGRSASLGALRIDMIKPRLAKYPESVRTQAEPLYARLNADAARQKVRVDELVTALHDGDIRRGQAVFNGTKAACRTCHAVGYVGGNIGPDLTSIGRVRVDRDLIESIVYPSASFVRSYEPVVVATKSGKSINGLIRKDASDELVLATGADKEERIPRDEIEEIRPSSVSLMPAGLDQQLTKQELADLIAFLKSRK